MRKFYPGILLAVIFSCAYNISSAQVSAYAFTQSTGTYNAITGGTVLATATDNTSAGSMDDVIYNIPTGSFPFTFTFNGTGYTGINVSSNGFITFGSTAPGTTTYSPISGTLTYSGVVSAFGGDQNSLFNIGGQTGELRWEVVGTAPNREIVIQWKSWRPAFTNSTTNVYSFNYQIRLHENNNISVVYGPGAYLVGSTTISGTRQVGLRGATNADFNNRTSTTSWTTTTAGSTNGSTVSFSTSTTAPIMPPSGLTFTWAPPVPCSGIPSVGNTVAGTNPICIGGSVNLSATGLSSGQTGIQYQWESSTDGVSYTPIPSATSSTYTANALLVNTYFRLKVTCTNTSESNNTTPVQVTLNAPTTVPYTQGFEGIASPGAGVVPSCWSTQLTTGANWTTANTPVRNGLGARTGTGYIWERWSSNAWLYSPGIQLTAGDTYDFSFYYRQTDAVNGFTITTAVGTSPTSAAMTTTLGTITNPVNTIYQQAKYSFTAPTTGVYFFGIRSVETTGSPWYFEIDDVEIKESVPEINYPAITGVCASGDVNLSGVNISTPYGVPTTGSLVPRIYYKKQGTTTWYSQPGVLASGSGTVGIWNFTIVSADMGGTATGDIIEYYVIAQDNKATPNISSNPVGVVATNVNSVTTNPVPNTYYIGQFAGTYTVGAGGNFADLATAAAAYRNACLSGSATLSLIDPTYTLTTPVTFANSSASSTNTLTIKPASNMNVTITGSLNNSALIGILGNYITIDGSNSASETRNLTITNTSTTGPSVVLIGSTGTTPVTNVTLKNSIVVNGTNTSSAVVIGDVLVGSAGYFNNITIQNNSIRKAYIGVYGFAATAAGNGSATRYINNDLSASGADAIRYIGLYAQGIDGLSIKGNTIGNFNGTDGESDKGLWVATGSKNVTIEKNKIFNLNYTGTGGYGGHGMYISTGLTNANVTVSNNMIANLSGDGWSYTSIPTDNPIGILLTGTQTGINIYFNSIHLYGNTLNQTSAMSMGIYLGAGSVATIKNNQIINKLGLVGATGYGAVGIYAVTNNAQLPGINHNNYWVSPTGSGNKYLGQIAATGQATLAGWQTASGGETQGQNIQTVFTSNTDLHIDHAVNPTLDAKGTPIAGITTDIDEDTRDASTPDIGADEFFPCVPAAITTQPTAQTVCTGSNITLTVTATGTGLTYQWRKAGVNITSATSSTYVINTASAGDAGSYDVVITGACGNATSNAVNVVVESNTSITGQPVNQTACIGTSATFTVTATGPGLIYQWRKGGVNIGSATTNTYTIASVTAGDVGSYDVVITGTCGTLTSNPATLTISSAAAISTQPQNQSACIGGSATFSVTASGGGLTYQWQKDGTDIPAATSSTLTINPVSAASVGSYTVTVNSACGTSLNSTAATLSITAATAITSQPQNQNVCANSSASFSVTATGANLTYQWRKNGAAIGGATSSTYNIASVTAGDVGTYDVIVTGTCGPVTSSPAILSFTNSASGVWLGSTSNDWNTASNWCGGVPTATTDVTIPAGAPNMPSISGTVNTRRLQINSGASLTVATAGRLNIHGDYVNSGTMTANGTVAFQGTFSQNVQALTAANVIMNTAFGIVLDGNMVVNNNLTLTNGNITTGNYTVTLNNTSAGTLASHIITSQSGVVIMNNINAGPVTIPVSPDALSYNPITLSNGQGRNYTVKVASGIVPSIQNPSIAVNRTWGILASGAALTTPVTVSLQYADADINANATGAANMEVGLHNGTNWSVISSPAGIAPTGTAAARVITVQSSQSGAFVLSNVGGTTAVPTIDADITSATLMPNVVNGRSVLRMNVRRAMKIDWMVTDMSGKIVKRFTQQLMPGQTDLSLELGNLANGTYQISGFTSKGKTQLLRFVKL